MDDFKKILEDFLKLPANLTEATSLVKKSAYIRSAAEEIAFRQTVINILVLAGIVTENDFNASVAHFKEKAFDDFAKKLLQESQMIKEQNITFEDLFKEDIENSLDDEDDDNSEWSDDDIAQA